MKIKFISLLLVVVLSCSGFIACGNSQKKQAMDELGISSAEYDEISSALNGSGTKSKSKSKVETTEKTEVVEEVKKEPIKYDQKEELKTYNLSDYVFQIDDKIIDLTPGKTVEEIVDIFSGYDIEVGNEDLNLDKLITEGGTESLQISNKNHLRSRHAQPQRISRHGGFRVCHHSVQLHLYRVEPQRGTRFDG